MNTPQSRGSRDPIRVTIFASLKLSGACLRALLNSERHLIVTNVAESHSELVKMAGSDSHDVVLVYLMDDDDEPLDLIGDLFNAVPDAKVIVLTGPNSRLDQPASLKMGVKGIVGTSQNFKVLTRAIQQVAEGNVWLNQKLVEQLLQGEAGTNGNNSSGRRSGTVHDLTSREMEIIESIGRGMNNREISAQLSIREATVRHHLSSIYSKLQIEDRLNLAILAYRQGLITPRSKGQ